MEKQKKRLLVSYDKLTPELKTALQQQYPDGYTDKIQRIDAPNPFYAVYLELSNAVYLIKVNIKEMIKGSVLDEDDDVDDDSSNGPSGDEEISDDLRDESFYSSDDED